MQILKREKLSFLLFRQKWSKMIQKNYSASGDKNIAKMQNIITGMTPRAHDKEKK